MRYFVALALALIAAPAEAGCVCRCVNGSMQPLCSSPMDMPPMCPPAACGIAPPSIAPIQAPSIPPIGTSSCRQVQVYEGGQYRWREVCR